MKHGGRQGLKNVSTLYIIRSKKCNFIQLVKTGCFRLKTLHSITLLFIFILRMDATFSYYPSYFKVSSEAISTVLYRIFDVAFVAVNIVHIHL